MLLTKQPKAQLKRERRAEKPDASNYAKLNVTDRGAWIRDQWKRKPTPWSYRQWIKLLTRFRIMNPLKKRKSK